MAELANAPDLKSVNPKGYVGSRPTVVAVTVADLVMQRIVVPPYVGSNPIGHLLCAFRIIGSTTGSNPVSQSSSLWGRVR